jgi:hypothetical protein
MDARGITNELVKYTSRKVFTVTRRATLNLRNTTPKKTGYAASNWVPSLGGTAQGPYGSKDAVDYSRQFAGIQECKAYRITRTAAPIIINSVPYIEKLNGGSSLKAPPLFVEAAIAKAIRDTTQVRQVGT